MCNDTNDRLFRAAKSVRFDEAALDNLRHALTRRGCDVYVEVERVLRDQLDTMVRESSGFDDLLRRLNEAGTEFLTTRFAPANPQQRDYRECDSARERLARDYREDIEGLVGMIRDEIASGQIDDLESLDTYLHETVDGCQRVIYTQQAKEACMFSDNDDAWEGNYEPDGNIDWSAMAYYVVEADIREGLDDLCHDEDAFDRLRLSGGFTRTLGAVLEVLSLELEEDEDEDTEVAISLSEDVWSCDARGGLELDEDDVLTLARDYDA